MPLPEGNALVIQEGVVSINVPMQMLARLVEHIEGCDCCYFCDCHPGRTHHGHDPECPLRNRSPKPEE